MCSLILVMPVVQMSGKKKGYLNHKKPFVSVVVVNYNGLKFLKNCLTSLLNTKYENFEIILVDNCSVNGSMAIGKKLVSKHPYHRIIQNKKNLGFAEGSNIGAKSSCGDYIAFLNNDTEVEPDWLDEPIKVMQINPSIGICQCKLLSLPDRGYFDSAGDIVDRYGVTIRRGGDWREEDVGQYDKVKPIFSARGAAMIVQRNVIEEVGLFDPLFSLAYTDIDLCWRARLRGYKVYYIPQSIVYHIGEGSTPTSTSVFYSTRNRIALLIKNYRLSNLVRYMPMALFIVFVAIVMELLQRKSLLALFRIKGMLSLLTHFRCFWKSRLDVQSRIRKVPDDEILKELSDHNLAVSYWLPIYLRSLLRRSKQLR